MRGAVRFFSGGWGIIDAEGVDSGVFAHRGQITDADNPVIYPREVVEFDLVKGEKSYEAHNIRHLEDFRPPKRLIGEVQFYNAGKKYGFITQEGGTNIFFCRFSVRHTDTLQTARPGDVVSFVACTNDRGPMAADIIIVARAAGLASLRTEQPRSFTRPLKHTTTTATLDSSPSAVEISSGAQPKPTSRTELDSQLREELHGGNRDYPASKTRKGDKLEKRKSKKGRT